MENGPCCFGLLAHVDAGKTTLSEAMLYLAGKLRRLGRVDHQDTYLDTDALEKERGITIFAKQAVMDLAGRSVTLLDTPGHADFSSEMERTLAVLDCAILVISGADGVQSHTRTLWRLLERYSVPTFLFINKMDQAGTDREKLLADLSQLGDGFVDFGGDSDSIFEEAAMGSEEALAEFLDTGALSGDTLRALIAQRKLFPCCFGAALKLEGVEAFLQCLAEYAPRPQWGPDFGAQVFKITRDSQGARLTHMKLTGGSLRVKTLLTGGQGDSSWEEKADQLRLYSGAKFQAIEEAKAGMVVAVTGLTHTRPGQALGAAQAAQAPALEPVLNYRILLPEGADVHTTLAKLRELEEEDPMLRILWDSRHQEIHVRLMGQIQQEVLQRLIRQRFGLEAAFGPGSIVYKETIAAPVEGVGHYEPLRHYAETRLLLEPLPVGSGLQVATACSEDQLDRNWQRLILTHLLEKPHLGVLTGSAVTDLRITLTAGRAHLKHTEGGDFRQATYRAVRQGLMSAESVLLEPWYDFRLEVPGETLGRAIGDLQQMSGRFDPPESMGELTLLTGSAPVSEMENYWQEVASYTRGRGHLSCTLRGYERCHNAEAVIAAIGYEPERDVDNPADSVFCGHGAGYNVKWDQVPAMAHTASALRPPAEASAGPLRRAAPPAPRSREEDAELQAIFERTYGQVKRREMQSVPRRPLSSTEKRTVPPKNTGPSYLLVDGYNIIFAWEELKEMARTNLESARRMLMDLLCNYQGFKKCIVILVFDAYKVKGNPGSVERYNNIHVVYTKEAETADTYIERATYEIAREHRVRVATSDNLEQLIILGHGAVRVPASELKEEVEAVEGSIRELLARNNRGGNPFRQVRHQAKLREDNGHVEK